MECATCGRTHGHTSWCSKRRSLPPRRTRVEPSTVEGGPCAGVWWICPHDGETATRFRDAEAHVVAAHLDSGSVEDGVLVNCKRAATWSGDWGDMRVTVCDDHKFMLATETAVPA